MPDETAYLMRIQHNTFFYCYHRTAGNSGYGFYEVLTVPPAFAQVCTEGNSAAGRPKKLKLVVPASVFYCILRPRLSFLRNRVS